MSAADIIGGWLIALSIGTVAGHISGVARGVRIERRARQAELNTTLNNLPAVQRTELFDQDNL